MVFEAEKDIIQMEIHSIFDSQFLHFQRRASLRFSSILFFQSNNTSSTQHSPNFNITLGHCLRYPLTTISALKLDVAYNNKIYSQNHEKTSQTIEVLSH